MRVRQAVTLVLVVGAALAAAAPARAQKQGKSEGPYREGFWIGVGLGYGSATISCSECMDNSRYGAATVSLRMGGTPSRQLLVGGEVDAWSRTSSDVTETVGDVSGVVLFYPSSTGTFFIKGGVGGVVYDANTSPKLETSGFGVSIGVGIDLYLGHRFSLTPYASYVTALSGTVKIGGSDTGYEAKPNLIVVGLAATWH